MPVTRMVTDTTVTVDFVPSGEWQGHLWVACVVGSVRRAMTLDYEDETRGAARKLAEAQEAAARKLIETKLDAHVVTIERDPGIQPVNRARFTVRWVREREPDSPLGLLILPEELSRWVGRPVTDDDVEKLRRALPHSSVPDAIGTILADDDVPVCDWCEKEVPPGDMEGRFCRDCHQARREE